MGKINYSLLKDLCSISKEKMNRSFNIIFEKYRKLVYFVSYDILKNEDESKDIVNETFLKMYEKRSTFINESNLKYFLLTTAKNASINRYNKRKNECSYCEEMGESNDENSVTPYLEKFKTILDEEEYQYLVLRLIYEFSFKEIANANNLTVSQVSSKYQRGLKKLRTFYEVKENE